MILNYVAEIELGVLEGIIMIRRNPHLTLLLTLPGNFSKGPFKDEAATKTRSTASDQGDQDFLREDLLSIRLSTLIKDIILSIYHWDIPYQISRNQLAWVV